MDKRPKVSIVVPVYNVEYYLPRCVDNLLQQTYTNIEVVLVDDGSSDNSASICDGYAQKDSRVKVIHKENGGVSAARNSGIDNISGEWVAFIDSDDWLETDAIEGLVELTDGKQVDMVIAGYNIVNDSESRCPCTDTRKTEILSRDEALTEMFRPKDYPYLGYVAGKLYRADIIKSKSIRFDNELSYNEDRLFCVTYLCAVTNKVAYTTRPAYNYYQRKGSLMNSLSNCYNPKYLSDFNAYLKMLNEVKQIKTNIPIKRWVKTGLCLSYKTIINMMISGKCYDKNAHHFMLGKLISSGGHLQYIRMTMVMLAKEILFIVYPKVLCK